VPQVHRTVAQAQAWQLRDEKERIKLLKLYMPGNTRDCAGSFSWEAALLVGLSRGESDLGANILLN